MILKGHYVTMQGYDDPSHVFYGIVAKVVDLREFQNASSDEWYWCARLEYEFLGELSGGWYPLRFLTKRTDGRN